MLTAMGRVPLTRGIEADDYRPFPSRPIALIAAQSGWAPANRAFRYFVVGFEGLDVALAACLRVLIVGLAIEIGVVRVVRITIDRNFGSEGGVTVRRILATDPKSYFERPSAQVALRAFVPAAA